MSAQPPLHLRDITVRRGDRVVVDRVSLAVQGGELIGLIGPNGAGKTTLMRAALGLIACNGSSDIAALPPARRALTAAWLPQSRDAVWPMTVEALVRLGRIPHRRPDADPAQVTAAMARMGIGDLRDRRVTELSGGEQARVLIARALAQDTPVLMADEPISGLDPAHQISAMQCFRDLAAEGRCVIVALHDLGLAARYCTRLVLMNAGRVVANGSPAAVLTPDLLAQVFGISGAFADTPDGPAFLPLSVIKP
ncbi:ABC transporter ATP-binding protein [Paracoccus pacificus]|uniref:ABC transporter ATP-binding protein n=1 Tax=Paracoccus pacificus TaxID=1463598 RepID=A0ABW4R945_9RHOB